MRFKSRTFIITACLSLPFLFFINGCHSFFSTFANADQTKLNSTITIALQEDLFSKSLEKDLMHEFGSSAGAHINFVSFKTLNQAESFLSLQKADVIFARTPLRMTNFPNQLSQVYDDLKLSVICSGEISTATDLYIPNNYFYIAQNEKFNSTFRNLKWAKSNLPAVQLKKRALRQPGFCFVTDTRLAKKASSLSPNLKTVWTTAKSEPVAWMVRDDLTDLNLRLRNWFQNMVRQNKIRKFWDAYENYDFNMSFVANKNFEKDIQNKLPEWQDLFEKYAHRNQIPWTLLAAVAYQESKWDNDARSYTGVRGLMQITTSTAEHLGIENRTDPEQSIEGGAFYLKYLYNKTPKNLSTYERWAQALAAYNMGWAHIRDARILAKNLNADSNRWLKFKKIIPLLSQEEYYRDLTFGSARGEETVDFVDQVFGYSEVLNTVFTRRSPTSQDF